MKDQVTICEASESDAAELLNVQKLAFHQQGILYDDFGLTPLVQTLEELIRDFEAHVFLKAVHQGSIVGSVRGALKETTCHISRLLVHPDYQNRGIGKKLMRAIECKFSDAERFELFTGHKSEKNLALYGKLGYREFRRTPERASVTLVGLEKSQDYYFPGGRMEKSG